MSRVYSGIVHMRIRVWGVWWACLQRLHFTSPEGKLVATTYGVKVWGVAIYARVNFPDPPAETGGAD